MAIKTTPYEVEIDISDMERNYYRTHRFTLLRGPNETEEKLMVRVLAFACQAEDGLSFGDAAEEATLCKRDGTGAIERWIDVGEVDDKRLLRACNSSGQVVVYSAASSAQGWWNQVGPKVNRDNLTVYHLRGVPTSGLGRLAERDMKLHCMIQDGQIWLTGNEDTIELAIDQIAP
ncbi:YaeQ family protein [bacterium]|nr:YaeQ family protein [bacterium]